jgi:L-fucose isomerase-like protein
MTIDYFCKKLIQLFYLMKYSIAYLSYNDKDHELKKRSDQILGAFFKPESFAIKSGEGKILFIASGGSEQNAVKLTKSHRNIILLCHRESNSYAAAIEIAAYLRVQNKRVSIIDVLAPDAYKEFVELHKVNLALEKIAQQKAALIGEVSDWLIISDVENGLVREKLGIDLKRVPWSEAGDYRSKKPSSEFLKYFPNHDPEKLRETSKVYSLLEGFVKEKNISAISVECFSMVMRDKVTACLPLAVLNNKNIIAACEGDLCSMLGKMLIRAITNEIPWQANVAEIKEDVILFAHCTAPLNVLKSFDITTHFETNAGTAIRGKFKKQKVGAFRINNKLDRYMLLQGEIINTPDHDFACRTQIEFKTTHEQAKLLKEQSLGNHHLIFPSKNIPQIERMMDVLGIIRVV